MYLLKDSHFEPPRYYLASCAVVMYSSSHDLAFIYWIEVMKVIQKSWHSIS